MTLLKTSLALALAAMNSLTMAAAAENDNDGPPPGAGGPPMFHHPPLPIVLALDTNHDGIIDAAEIANASAALLTLDLNHDGVLTTNEYMPPLPTNAPARRHLPPTPLIVKALDANGDGIIDASEIANAAVALKTLDKNGDGVLTRDEYIGRRPGRPPQGGPGGNGGGADDMPAGGPPPDGSPEGPQDGPPPGDN